ncbi:MAG: formate/nitrite transporter family protein [Lentisphaeria bacterium]|nr:formate/nitrite transporter family protein [Lentisphaeria bacterium]
MANDKSQPEVTAPDSADGTAPESERQVYTPTLSPKEFAQTVSVLGIRKANTRSWQLFILALLAGLYISFGGHAYLVCIEQGMGRIVGGMAFSVGLVLVVVAGAELFTGNVIMIVGAMTLLFPWRRVFKNWATVYAGNFVGSILFAWLIWKSGLLGMPGALNGLGQKAVSVAEGKLALPFAACFIRGMFCNMLVVLAIIMATMSKDVISKIVCCMMPVAVFVACGFEHCVANMYLIPVGLLAKGMPLFQQGDIFHNLLPVTLGNIVGGVLILVIHPNRIRQLIHLWQNRTRYRDVIPH